MAIHIFLYGAAWQQAAGVPPSPWKTYKATNKRNKPQHVARRGFVLQNFYC